MALEAWLTFTSSEGQTTDQLKILECDYQFTQDIDETGKPSAKPTGGQINLTVESTEKSIITEWMFAKLGYKNGKLVFPLRNGKRKELMFEDGVCISYHEAFNAINNMPMTLHFTISANTIKLGDQTFSNDWKK
jgi:hypothetical protein